METCAAARWGGEANALLDAIRAGHKADKELDVRGRDCDCGDAAGDAAEHRSWIAAYRIGTRLDADARV